MNKFPFYKRITCVLSFFQNLMFIIGILSLVELNLFLFAEIYKIRLSKLYQSNLTKNYKIKILAVGESTTSGLWVEDESYPIQLEKLLNTFYQCIDCSDVSILAAPGGSTSSLLAVYPTKVIEYKPDIILLMTGVNDIHQFAYNIDPILLELAYRSDIKPLHKTTIRLINGINSLRVFRILKWSLANVFLSKDRIDDAYENDNFPESGSKLRQSFYSTYKEWINNMTEENIVKMIDIAKRNSVLPIVMTYHSAGVNQLLREISRKNQVMLIENEVILKHLDFNKYVLEKDNWHPNSDGYKLMADNIFKNLSFYRLLPN